MRFVDCAQIWHNFEDLHRHLLLMMDFKCPFGILSQKGGVHTYLRALCLVFRGRVYFCWLELVELV